MANEEPFAGEYLGAQVIDDVTVIAGERRNEPAAVDTVLHGERSQVQPAGPALGPLPERGDVRRREAEVKHVVQKCFGVAPGEGEIARPQLAELAARSDPRDWERRAKRRPGRECAHGIRPLLH